MILPPIFSLVLFFILDTVELVFDIFVITSPIGVFMSILSTILYILILLFKYGPKKTKERLFTFKKVPRTKAFKKIMKVFGASFIPFMTTWAVWDDYKEDLKEKKTLQLVLEEEKKKELNLKQKVASEQALLQKSEEVRMEEAPATSSVTSVSTESTSETGENDLPVREDERMETPKNPWIKSTRKEITQKRGNEKTISEEVGGMKTGLSREDYDADIRDYSKPETYQTLIEEKRKEKEERDKQTQKEAKVIRMQDVQKKKTSLREDLEKSTRRYGKNANIVKDMRDKYREDVDEENKMAA